MRTPEYWATAIGKGTGTATVHQSDMNILVQAIQRDALDHATQKVRMAWAASESKDYVLIGLLLQPLEDEAEKLTWKEIPNAPAQRPPAKDL
jgi:hypothetical protein